MTHQRFIPYHNLCSKTSFFQPILYSILDKKFRFLTQISFLKFYFSELEHHFFGWRLVSGPKCRFSHSKHRFLIPTSLCLPTAFFFKTLFPDPKPPPLTQSLVFRLNRSFLTHSSFLDYIIAPWPKQHVYTETSFFQFLSSFLQPIMISWLKFPLLIPHSALNSYGPHSYEPSIFSWLSTTLSTPSGAIIKPVEHFKRGI